MSKRKTARRKRLDGKPALDLIEEALALLRNLPLEALFAYYLGALPFVFGLIYFWADMSRGRQAWQHLPETSLALALLWIWMKCWQAVFAARLRARIHQAEQPRLNPAGILRTGLRQAFMTPLSIFVLPVALLLTIPFGWCLAFFQNVTILDDGRAESIRQLGRRAWAQALLWPRQNHVLIAVILLFSLFVFLNFFVAIMVLPGLVKSLLGIETTFAMGNYFLVNSTLWTIVAGLTYLAVDPLVKTAYLLRCYYGTALSDGADLLAALRQAATRAGQAAALVLLTMALSATARTALATDTSPQAIGPQLDAAIEREIGQLESSWRMPRETVEEIETEQRSGFFGVIVETIRYWGRAIGDSLEEFFKWLFDLLGKMFPKVDMAPSKAGGGGGGMAYLILYGLLALALCFAAVIIVRYVSNRRRRSDTIEEAAPLADIDLESDEVTAADRPSDEWLALARELLQKGEYRLGIRALYLSNLAMLADVNLLTIDRAKSDHDYIAELKRQGRAGEPLQEAFGDNISIFQQAWYGMRDIHEEMLRQFLDNHKRIMTDAGAR